MRQAALILLKLGVSIVVAVAAPYFGFALTPQEKVILVLLIFAAASSLELLLGLKDLQTQMTRQQALWRVEDDFDGKLSNIRKDFRELVRSGYGPKDLYVDYFTYTVDEVARIIREASETKSLMLRNYHFRSIENVLAAFEGSSSKAFRELWVLEEGEELFNNLSREYFAQIAIMTRKGEIKSVRTIFIYHVVSVLQMAEVKRLLAFYASWKGFDCRLVRKDACDSLMRDEKIGEGCVDFGIYGDRYLFRTVTYRPDVRGVFTKDQPEIQRHIRFFENLWASASSAKNPERGSGVTLEQIVGVELVKAVEG